MFREFVNREFTADVKGRENRLEEWCSKIHYENGESVLDRFNAEERKLRQKLERSWGLER